MLGDETERKILRKMRPYCFLVLTWMCAYGTSAGASAVALDGNYLNEEATTSNIFPYGRVTRSQRYDWASNNQLFHDFINPLTLSRRHFGKRRRRRQVGMDWYDEWLRTSTDESGNVIEQTTKSTAGEYFDSDKYDFSFYKPDSPAEEVPPAPIEAPSYEPRPQLPPPNYDYPLREQPQLPQPNLSYHPPNVVYQPEANYGGVFHPQPNVAYPHPPQAPPSYGDYQPQQNLPLPRPETDYRGYWPQYPPYQNVRPTNSRFPERPPVLPQNSPGPSQQQRITTIRPPLAPQNGPPSYAENPFPSNQQPNLQLPSPPPPPPNYYAGRPESQIPFSPFASNAPKIPWNGPSSNYPGQGQDYQPQTPRTGHLAMIVTGADWMITPQSVKEHPRPHDRHITTVRVTEPREYSIDWGPYNTMNPSLAILPNNQDGGHIISQNPVVVQPPNGPGFIFPPARPAPQPQPLPVEAPRPIGEQFPQQAPMPPSPSFGFPPQQIGPQPEPPFPNISPPVHIRPPEFNGGPPQDPRPLVPPVFTGHQPPSWPEPEMSAEKILQLNPDSEGMSLKSNPQNHGYRLEEERRERREKHSVTHQTHTFLEKIFGLFSSSGTSSLASLEWPVTTCLVSLFMLNAT